MSLTMAREDLLKPLQRVVGAVERRQTLPILGNVLLKATKDGLSVTATDLEIELHDHVAVDTDSNLEITVPARKLFDICKSLPEQSMLKLTSDNAKLILSAGRSRFTLATLPADEFPVLEGVGSGEIIQISQRTLKRTISKTAFSMAQQDVRYYLNGLLLELDQHCLRTVSTDGHRLSMNIQEAELNVEQLTQAIVPRKGVLELSRLLEDVDDIVELKISANHIRFQIGSLRFTSKLIEGRFPDYQRVIPANCENKVLIDREVLKQALQRVAILSNEKYKGIRLNFESDSLTIQTNNPEQEEAEEEIVVEYNGDSIEIGFNVAYLQDVLSSLDSDKVEIALRDGNSSGLITGIGTPDCKYVVMPMRL